jgi:hypothetical protein
MYLTGNRRQADVVAVRLFLIEESGKPVSGVVVSISAEAARDLDTRREEESPSIARGRLLATLQTDKAGYASFKFASATLTGVSQLVVAYGTSLRNASRLNVADLLTGNDSYTIRLDASSLNLEDPAPGFPAVMAPDCRDAVLSPGSIGLTPQLLPDRGLCSQLMPTTLSVRRFEAFRVILSEADDICHPETLSCPDRIQIVKGRMLEYEIAWHPAGTSLGDLLNTITLAPCEQVNLAVVDWMRRETAVLTQASEMQQQASQQMNHDRLISEAMQSSVKNKSLTGASGTTSGATMAIPIEAMKLDMTAAWGAGVAGGISTQTVAANTSNQLSERIAQTSSFVASQRSSTVFQTTASEHQTYQTRTVRNHNHCHTLTMMYYQVNRSYCVVTDYKGWRDVILVKYENKDFDAQRAYCNAEILKDALLDSSLRGCFDELGTALFCCEKKAVGQDVFMDSFTLTLNLTLGNGFITQIQPILNTANGPVSMPWTNVGWQAPGIRTQTFNLPGQVDPKQVTSIVVFFQYFGGGGGISGGGSLFFASDIDVTYHAVGYPDPLTLSSLHTSTHLSNSLDMAAKAELPPITKAQNPCVDASCCIQKLLGHLNCHKRYYNSIVWLNEDPNERVMRWSCCQRNNQPFSLIDQIENIPLTVYGDFVVFPVAGSQLVDDPAVLPVSKLVTMPTPGVYAEGILGQCDTCELINPDRRWDWKDSPCPDNAPSVDSPPAPQGGVKVSDLKADAITSLVSFSTVPEAPASGIKELIAALLENADKGSAEASKLLEKLLDTIKDSIPPSTGLPEPPKKE